MGNKSKSKSKLSDYLHRATDKTAVAVEEELKNKDDRIDEMIAELRRMVLECDDEILKSWRFQDEFLVRFIRGRKYNMKSAFEKLQNNVHSKRVTYPEIFASLYPGALRHVLELKSMRILKNRDSLGRQICIFRPETFDPNMTTVDDMLRVQIMVVWEMMSLKETQLNGIIVIVDGSGFAPRQLKALTRHHVQKYITLTLKCSPTRFKGCHILNLPQVFHYAMQMIRPLLPGKVHSRLFTHGHNLSVFYKIIPRDILPDWIGGSLHEDEACDIALEKAILGKDEYYKDLIQ